MHLNNNDDTNEQSILYYVIDKLLLVLGLLILVYRRDMSDESFFYTIHISPVFLSSICFGLSAFVFGEKIQGKGYESHVVIHIFTVGTAIFAIWDQIDSFL